MDGASVKAGLRDSTEAGEAVFRRREPGWFANRLAARASGRFLARSIVCLPSAANASLTRAALVVMASLACLAVCRGGETPPAAEPAAPEPKEHWNLEQRTLGGKQFWTDEVVFRDWRIQRHALTGHCRLLDDRNRRRAWGSLEQCRRKLEELKRELDLPPMKGKAVVVLHGLGRSRSAMAGLCRYLSEKGGYTAINVSYASTRADLATHAASLRRIIENLDGVDEINFVAHSLGNLVVRRYFADAMDAGRGGRLDPRIGRFVMLAPPNQGSGLAARFRRNKLFEAIFGASGSQLARQWETVQKQLATPPCPFGIIAGDATRPAGGNPLLEGEDDLVVTVAETRLPGARDFLVVPAIHTVIMDDPQVRACTLTFLRHGYFVSEGSRRPIMADESPRSGVR